MTVAQGQFTIFQHIDGHTPVLGEDYFEAPYMTDIIWQYYLSDSVKALSPTVETTVTFDDNTMAIVGTWVDIVSESDIPVVKGLVNGVAITYYRFRRQKYIWSDHTEEDPHITYSSAHLDETDKRILEWCSGSDSTYIDGAHIYAGSVTAEQIDATNLRVDAANIDNTLTAGQINTEGLQAEYIKSSDYSVSSPYSLDSLVFTMRSDGETYKVGLKQGAATETIIVPPVYDEKPVVEVDGDSFVDGKYIVKTLVLPSSITTMPFAFLEGYSVLEELHIPIHTNAFANNADLCFANWFGETSSEAESRLVPATLQKVVIVAGKYVPAYYFAFISSSVFLVSTIANLRASSFAGFTGRVYYCGNKENLTVAQYNGISTAGVKKEDIEEVGEYVQPTFSIEALRGFKITSVENEPMIDSPHFKVTQDGEVVANKGDIAGWEITEDRIHKKDADGNSLVGMSASADDSYASLVDEGDTSPVRFYAGYQTKTVTVVEYGVLNNQTFTYSSEDCMAILSASGYVGNTGGGGCKFNGIGTDTLTVTWNGTDNVTLTIVYTYYTFSRSFQVLEDGSLYASAANISLNDTSSSINVGTMSMCCNSIGDASLSTTGELKIEGKNGASIKLYGLDEAQTPELFKYDLYAKGSGGTHWLQLRSKIKKKVYHTETVRIMYKYVNGGELIYSLPIDFKIPSGSSESEVVNISPDVDYGSGYLWFVYGEKKQINVPKEYDNYSDGNPLVSDAIEFSQTETTQFVLIQGDLKVSGDVWSRDEKIGDSDRNIKNSILPLNQSHDQIFDSLKPVSYKFNNNTSNRTHTGLIAQDVKEAVENAGLTTQDFAAYCEWENSDGSTGCGLRYGEFISLCIDQIQKLKKRVEELEEKLNNTQ